MKRPTARLTYVLVAVGAIIALAPLLLLLVDDDQEGAANDAESQTQIWCEDVASTMDRAGAPFASFAEVVDALLDGDLVEPTDQPPTTDDVALLAWQQEHRAFLDASFLSSIEEYPRGVGYHLARLQVAIGEAPDGDLPEDPSALREAAQQVDTMRAEACG